MRILLFWLVLGAMLALGIDSDAIRDDPALVDFNLRK